MSGVKKLSMDIRTMKLSYLFNTLSSRNVLFPLKVNNFPNLLRIFSNCQSQRCLKRVTLLINRSFLLGEIIGKEEPWKLCTVAIRLSKPPLH